MRILYFHEFFSTPAGSTGTRSYEMAKHLVERGHRVTMVCGSHATGRSGLSGPPVRGLRRGQVEGIDVIEICVAYSNHDTFVRRTISFLRYALRGIAVAWKTEYDLLFATSTPLTAGIPGIAMRLLRPTRKFVFEVRDLWPELPREMGVITNPAILWAMSILEKRCYAAANGCIGLSPGIVDGIRHRSDDGKPIVMIPNGADLDMLRPPEGGRRQKRGLRAIFTGAHGIANGLDAVLDAATILKARRRSDIELLFIGDGKLKSGLVTRALNEALTNCTFLDPVPKLALSDVLDTVDLGLMVLANVPAFYYGTSPNKFFDYIACGLPVLNNYPGWIAELIQHNRCGIVVPPDDPGAFADALVTFADDPPFRAACGSNARALAEREFARRRLAGQFADFLENQAKNTMPVSTEMRVRRKG